MNRIATGMAFAVIGIATLSARHAWADSPPLQDIVIVFKTHFDIGYTDLARNIVQRYRTTMIDQALEVVDQNRNLPADRQFVWTIPGWPLTKILDDWPGQTPERKQRILRAFREGRFVVHALPFSTHTELLEPEDLVRGLGFAAKLSRDAGLPLPRDAKMTDVPCHSWVLPTLLKHAGVDFLHLGCNAASSSPHVPALFWWEGPDGSRLLTMYSASGYGTGLDPPADWPYRTWLALFHTGDNHGPPRPDEVKKVLDEAAKKFPGVRVRIGRLSDFADRIVAEKAQIPVVRGDMPDTWIHGPMCDPAGARLAKNVRPAIGMAESLNTLLRFWGAAPTADVAAEAYEQSLLYGEHTWGGALSWITRYGPQTNWHYGAPWRAERAAGRFQRLEESWAEHSRYIENARDRIVPLLAAEMQTLARSVNAEGPRVVVFNPLPWKRTAVATLPKPAGSFSQLRPSDGGPAIATFADADGVHFVASDLPALGYRTYLPAENVTAAPAAGAERTSDTLENRWFKVTLDPARGAIGSLIEKRTGRELVDTSSPHGFGQYFYERFDADQVAAYVKAYVKTRSDWAIAELGKPNMPPAAEAPYRAVSPANCRAEMQRTAETRVATMHSEPTSDLAHAVTTKITLYGEQPWFDLEVTLHDKPADPWPEAGWICLPFKIAEPQYRLGRLGSIIDPQREIVPGANCDLLGINTGVAIFDAAGHGVGLCARDNPLLSFGQPGVCKYSAAFAPQRPSVYVNLFNNLWTTNFRLWNSGTWTARVRIWAFDRYDPESSLITPALEARYPLAVGCAEGTRGSLPASQAGVELSARGTLITALGPNPDGSGRVLRLWEMAGKSGPCRIRAPRLSGVRQVQPASLRGEPLAAPLPITDGEVAVQLRGFAPLSLLLPPHGN